MPIIKTADITKLKIGKVYIIKSYIKLYKEGNKLTEEVVLDGFFNEKVILLEVLTPKNKLIDTNRQSFYRMKFLIVNSGIVGWAWQLDKSTSLEIKELIA